MFVPICRLQDVCPFIFKRGWYWEGLACVLVLRRDERTLRCHLVLAVHSSGDHAAPRPIRTEQPCAGDVPTRSRLVLLPEATVRDEHRHGMPSVHLQDRFGSAQDFVHEGQHDVHPDYCGIKMFLQDTMWEGAPPILGFSQQLLKMGVIDLYFQGHLAISTQEPAFNTALAY